MPSNENRFAAADPVDALLARLEAEEAKMRNTPEPTKHPDTRPRNEGHADGLKQARILAVHHLRGEAARDAYIAGIEGQPPRQAGNAEAATKTPDLIRDAIADAVTINNGPLIDHAAAGVLYALGLAELPPADGAPGPAEEQRLRRELARMQEAGDRHIRAAEAERDEARAAIEQVRRFCELTIAASVRVQAVKQARDTLAVLDGATAPQTTA